MVNRFMEATAAKRRFASKPIAEVLRVRGGSAIPEPTPSPLGSAADPST